MRRTQPIAFWAANRQYGWNNPARRWYYHRIVAWGIGLSAAGIGLSYMAAKHYGYPAPDALAGIAEALPLGALSRVWGVLAATEALPAEVHAPLIDAFVWATAAAVDEAEWPLREYRTLQHFFSRRLRPGVRPVSADAVVVAPCDGEVLAVAPVDGDVAGIVKGQRVLVSQLVRTGLSPAVPEGMTRYAVAMRLPVGGYHRFHSPADFQVHATTHVPGTLLPSKGSSPTWFPHLYVSNERVVISGETPAGAGVAMSCVGGLCTGRIKMRFDSRVQTNGLEEIDTTITRRYQRVGTPVSAKGEELGHFEFGSAVLLVVDVPTRAKPKVGAGAFVKVGEAIFA